MPVSTEQEALPETTGTETANAEIGTAGTGATAGAGTVGTAGMLAGSLAAIGGIGAIAAGAGGGGGGDDGGAGTVGDDDDDDIPDIGVFETAEYTAQYGLGLINAASAYARGGTGAGVVVSVIDSGLDFNHPEFVGRIAPGGYDFIEDTDDVTDTDGHGTHVAGIIAANRDGTGMHGVAYDAKILPMRVIDVGGGTNQMISDAIDRSIAYGAKVMNGSYGPYVYASDLIQDLYPGTEVEANAYQRAADSGMILVFAAGNDYDINPTVAANPTGAGLFPYVRPANADTGIYDDFGADYDFSGLDGMLLAVAAVGPTGQIAGYSNRCGVAADWCLAAPGGDYDGTIYSTYPSSTYAGLGGTSMAAPHVSGAVAILIDLFPELTPQQIVARLLATANDTGIYADASIYGRGLLDLEAATRPIGGLGVATATTYDTASFDLSESVIALGSAFGDGLRASLNGTKLAVFDSYGATFAVDLTSMMALAGNRIDYEAVANRFGQLSGLRTIDLGNGSTLRYRVASDAPVRGVTDEPGQERRGRDGALSLTSRLGDAFDYSFGYNVNPGFGFGIDRSGAIERNLLIADDALAAPYFAFAERGYAASASIRLDGLGYLRAGSFHGRSEGSEDTDASKATAFGSVVELAVPVAENGTLSFQAGTVMERETLLGSRTEGAFKMDEDTPTYFGGITAQLPITPHLAVVGSAFVGLSMPKVASDSLFTDISPIGSDAFSLGIVGTSLASDGDRWGIVLNQPLRVSRGTAKLGIATGRERSGKVRYTNVSAELEPTGRELSVEAYYSIPLAERSVVSTSAMLRTEPGHVADADPEGILLMRLQHRF